MLEYIHLSWSMTKTVGSVLVGNGMILLLSVLLFQPGQSPLLPFPWSSLGQELVPASASPQSCHPRGTQEEKELETKSHQMVGAACGQFPYRQCRHWKNKAQSQTSLMEITQLGTCLGSP